MDDGDRTFQHEPAGAWTLEIIDKGLTTRAHETPPLFVHGGITPRGGGTSTSSITSQPGFRAAALSLRTWRQRVTTTRETGRFVARHRETV